jgi:hypothetical protein
MAPAAKPTAKPGAEPLSTPLADYFWIAGVDGTEILDIFSKLGEEYNANRAQNLPVSTDTIQEDAAAEEEQDMDAASRRRSSQFLSNTNSNEARLSFRSFEWDNNKENHSNRSSTTIKGSLTPNGGGGGGGPSFLNEADFDRALLKFASERDSFLNDLSLNAGAILPNRPKPRPKTQKIVAEDVNPNPLKSGIGSVRRHMSFRDMNSMKRQPSSVARQGKSLIFR